MSEDESARFRQQAEEFRQQSEKAISPRDKQAWLRTAEESIKLAISVEERQEKLVDHEGLSGLNRKASERRR
jgi:hypothetical protein